MTNLCWQVLVLATRLSSLGCRILGLGICNHTTAVLCAMDLKPRALLMCVFLLGVVRFIIHDLSEQEMIREYARQIRVAHNNATAETKLIDSGRQISRTILMILQLL